MEKIKDNVNSKGKGKYHYYHDKQLSSVLCFSNIFRRLFLVMVTHYYDTRKFGPKYHDSEARRREHLKNEKYIKANNIIIKAVLRSLVALCPI